MALHLLHVLAADRPTVVVESRGFNWVDAAIGAGAVIGLLLAAAGALVLARIATSTNSEQEGKTK